MADGDVLHPYLARWVRRAACRWRIGRRGATSTRERKERKGQDGNC